MKKQKNKAAVALGRLSAEAKHKGMTAKQKKEHYRQMALTRWNKTNDTNTSQDTR